MGIEGMADALSAQYEHAVRKLFPQGDYWDKQFADLESDISLFAKAKLEELIRFRGRMNALLGESRIETTEELIADWERVLLGEVTYGKTLEEQRLFLKSKQDNKLNRAKLQKIADMYGLTITGITFPYRPAFFSHTFFNTSFLGGPVCFSVLLITAVWGRVKFRVLFKADYPIQQFGTMRFGLGRLAFFPINRLRYYLNKSLRPASAGFFKMGVQRLFPSPVYKIRPMVEERLRAASAGFMYFGTHRLIYSPIPAMRRIAARLGREGSAGFMRTGIGRLMYSPVWQIKKTVYDRLLGTGAGFARCGQCRLMVMPFYRIGRLLKQQFRSTSFGAIKFGLSRLAHYSGGFSDSLVRHEPDLFSFFVKTVFRKSGVIPKTDTLIVDAITMGSGFRHWFDTSLVREILLQGGLLAGFDRYFTQGLIQKNKFYPRLEKAFINYIVRDKALFRDFEQAVQDKLLANQIPYFNYEGA
jgi:hypothetical protein